MQPALALLGELMLKTLFWNVKSRQLGCYIAELCDEYDLDLLIVAEPPRDEFGLLAQINSGEARSTFISLFSPSGKFLLFTRLPVGNVLPLLDDDGLSIREVTTAIGGKILVCAVHLPSKLHFSEFDQATHAARIVKSIRGVEERVGNRCTMVVGDFNMNPFDKGMISASAFNAVMDKRIAARGERQVQGVKYRYFYNPMWSLMGDGSHGPPGSHYYSKSAYLSSHWHMLDQVLLSPELLALMTGEVVKVVSATRSTTLACDKNFRPKASDHFPVFVGLT